MVRKQQKKGDSPVLDHKMIGLGIVSFVAVVAMAVLVFIGSSQQLTGRVVDEMDDVNLILYYGLNGQTKGDWQVSNAPQSNGYFQFAGTTDSYLAAEKVDLSGKGVTVSFTEESFQPDKSGAIVSYSVGSAQGGTASASAASDEFLVWYDNTPNRRAIVVSVRGTETRFLQKTNPFASSTPQHLAVTWREGTGEIKLYLDGTLIGSRTGISRDRGMRAPGSLVIGQDQDCRYPMPCSPFGKRDFKYKGPGGFDSAQSLKGELSDIRIYSRVLTANEVAVLAAK